jgi:hypothetical protein
MENRSTWTLEQHAAHNREVNTRLMAERAMEAMNRPPTPEPNPAFEVVREVAAAAALVYWGIALLMFIGAMLGVLSFT